MTTRPRSLDSLLALVTVAFSLLCAGALVTDTCWPLDTAATAAPDVPATTAAPGLPTPAARA